MDVLIVGPNNVYAMTIRIKTRIIVLFCWMIAMPACWMKQEAHTPHPGSPERQAIMDVMRLDSYRYDPSAAQRNHDGIFFKVLYLKVQGDWALTFVQPEQADGTEIAKPRWGLLHRNSGRWSNVDYFKAISSYPMNDFDALDMKPVAIRAIMREFPDVPRDIFPE